MHTYDAILYNGDSGAVFVRGTTEVVAERIQRYFDNGREPGLVEALRSGYRAATMKPAVKLAAAKPAAGKKAAAKKTAKKAAGKKTAKK